MNYDKISKLIKRYEEIKNESVSNEKLYHQATLREVVLTGAEIVEKGILEKIINIMEIETNEQIQERFNELKEEYNEVMGEKSKLQEESDKLKLEKKELDDSLASKGIYEASIMEVRKIIKGKSGSFIDELREICYSGEE